MRASFPSNPERLTWSMFVCVLALVLGGCGTSIPSGNSIPDDAGLCTDSCRWAHDDECDDGGPGADFNVCAYGTDCADCGTRHGDAPVDDQGGEQEENCTVVSTPYGYGYGIECCTYAGSWISCSTEYYYP